MDLSRVHLERLREDADFVLYRSSAADPAEPMLWLAPTPRAPRRPVFERLERELALAEELEPAWALQPLGLARHEGQSGLALRDPGGQPLDRLLAEPMELGRFLSLAIGLCDALSEVHAKGLIHKDLKPANVFVDPRENVRLTGFGLASRLARERQAPAAPEAMSGSFQYMSPEQTGRMNRAIDARSDLYSLGVTLYQMLVGALPFMADDPLDWIHCHIARLPPPPSVRVDGVPPTIEAIILKLLAKNAEDRYQTAAGVAHDLRRFQAAWRQDRNAGPFPLAEFDRPTRLIIPEKLYGRAPEIGVLTAAFQEVAQRGKFELVLVSGPSGVGKSAVINELQPAVHAARGLFASGKFDHQKRDIPYSIFAEAFRTLLRRLLGADEATLEAWRRDLREAVGASGQLLVDLLPELGLVLGPLAPPPLLSAADEKARFQLIFRQFIGVFARPEHPLVLVLDDLQWLDPASLDLLERLAIEDETSHLLVVCGLRTGKPEKAHRLPRMLKGIRASRGALKEVRLSPLAASDVAQFVADALQSRPREVLELADIILQKTHGNPFFLVQFLTMLNGEGLLVFDSRASQWRWDLDAVRARAMAENVGSLMADKLGRYGPEALAILTRFSCLGQAATTAALSRVLEIEEGDVDAALRPFVDADLIHRSANGYAFAHDGVRDAAYARIVRRRQPEAHLQVGRLLAAGLDSKAVEDGAFELANQFNRGLDLITSPDERRWLTHLNLIAGKRAKTATAYEAALAYLEVGVGLLVEADWEAEYRTAFELQLHRADCLFILGQAALAEAALEALADRSRDLPDRAQVVGRQMILHAHMGRSDDAIRLGLDCLARMGVCLNRTPSDAEVRAEYDALLSRLQARPIASLSELPAMVDRHWLEVMGLLEELMGPVAVGDGDLLDLVLLRAANISLDHGCSHESCHALANVGARVFGWRAGSMEDGHELCRAAIRLMEERGFDRYAARVYAIVSGVVAPWSRPLQDAYDIARRVIDMPRERGGVGYSGYAWVCGLTAVLDGGRRLDEVAHLVEQAEASARAAGFGLVIELIAGQRRLVDALRGDRGDGSAELRGFCDPAYEAHLRDTPGLLHARIRYQVRKLQFLVFAGRAAEGLPILEAVGGNLGESPVLLQSPVFEVVEYALFSALARAAHLTSTPRKAWGRHLEAIQTSAAQLADWARRCPENFGCRAHLVAAEVARLEGRELEAQRLYEQAIQTSRDNGFLQIEGLANELAAQFHGARGLGTIAAGYLRGARECFELWGAEAKVRQLDARYPGFRPARPPLDTLAEVGRGLQHVDLRALIGMYQAVSEEIVLDRLVERLMITMVEHAGAVRGLLLLPRDGELRIAAEAVSRPDAVRLVRSPPGPLHRELPVSVLNFVARTQQPVILDDARESNAHGDDPYWRTAQPRSVLCLPLVKQQRLVGAVYLENELAAHVFTADRIAVLQLLASQAAISIENAELFRNVQAAQEQARQAGDELRRTFDLMPTMAWRTDADGHLEVANKSWHDYTGRSPDEALDYLAAVHPEDVDKVRERWRHLSAFRTSGEIEARMRRFDGQYRSFLVRATPLRDETGAVVKWHGSNTDIETLKRAEEAQEALARVSRVTAMGELTVSIAHEVNQPLMAIVTNAASCLSWLSAEPPDVAEARRSAERIVRDGHRAGEVIHSIRALARKGPTQFVPVDLNEVITEALLLTRNALDRNAIAVETRLAPETGAALGDRVQMEQVVLNLIMNAIEAMSLGAAAPRALQIRTEPARGGFVQVSVSDTGVGVDEGDAERIFDAFFTTKVGGVGMGLSICRSIIESHGGRIGVTRNAGCGCTFTFEVPEAAMETLDASIH